MGSTYVYGLDSDIEETAYLEAITYLEDTDELVDHNTFINHLSSEINSIDWINAASLIDKLPKYLENSDYDKNLQGGKNEGYWFEE